MITIKELHGDLFEEGTEFRIADTFGDDPDAVWISRQDFEILGARPVDMLSRTFFLYYKGDERKRIVCADPKLLHGQVKLNIQDYGDFVARDDAYTLNLFRPYRILLEQYLILEKFSEDKITGLLMATARKFFRKLLLYYCSLYAHVEVHDKDIGMPDNALAHQSYLYMVRYNKGIVKIVVGNSVYDIREETYFTQSLHLLYKALGKYPPSLALPMKLPEMPYREVEETSIPLIDYMHWDELRKQGKQINADFYTIVWHFAGIIEIWKNEVVPIIQEWEKC